MSEAVVCLGVGRTFYTLDGQVVRALEGVDLHVSTGEVVAIEGPSGSGKTSLLAILAGLDLPDAGTALVLGHDMARLQPAERARLRRSRIGVVLQTFGLVPSISVLDNVALPLALDGVESVSAGSRSREALAQVGLERQASARVDELSGGQRQRVAIARAMVIGPELILADEPIGNLDEGSGRQVVELLRGLAREGGAALVIVTHDPLTARGADRRIGLRDGRILAAPERDAIAGVHTR